LLGLRSNKDGSDPLTKGATFAHQRESSIGLVPVWQRGTKSSMTDQFSGPLAGLVAKSIPDLTGSFVQFADGLQVAAERACTQSPSPAMDCNCGNILQPLLCAARHEVFFMNDQRLVGNSSQAPITGAALTHRPAVHGGS